MNGGFQELQAEKSDDESNGDQKMQHLDEDMIGETMQVYMQGQTTYGQLGVGFTTQKDIKLPQRVSINVQLINITCGAGHSVALSKHGQVYSWGLNLLGQLGHGDSDSRW